MTVTPQLFPLGEYWWLYTSFLGFVLILLGLDLGVFHRTAREVTFREAAAWCAGWVALALAFNAGLYAYALWRFPRDERLAALSGFDPEAAAWQVALEFLTGYVVEYSLSVDNIFVFLLVLGYFRVPRAHQHRVLFYGILGALVFRAIFISVGAVLMQFHWVVWLFGLFLVYTGIRMAVASEEAPDPERTLLIRLVKRVLPVTGYRGDKFLVRQGGKLAATPLMIALLCLEASDIVFAVDSVPAIFALTNEPFIVFTSNVFAILGLRSMFFMLGGAVERFHLLRYGLAAVLVFVGLKMVWLDATFGGKFPIGISLGIIGGTLGLALLLSLAFPKRPVIQGRAKPTARPSSRVS
ncbi:MAG: TerC family protein [Candidatus Rokubacteria bacterium]|nr:TerC family protein [Candidatus Rokubacteria bacterium]